MAREFTVVIERDEEGYLVASPGMLLKIARDIAVTRDELRQLLQG